MTEDAILAEIERLSLQTTDKAPMQMFLEFEQLRKAVGKGKLACMAIGVVAALVAFFGFGDRLDSLPPFGTGGGSFLYSCFIGLALFAAAAVVWRRLIDARIRAWFTNAERLIQASGPRA